MRAKRVIIKSLSPVLYFTGFIGILLALMYAIGEHLKIPHPEIVSSEETWFIIGLVVMLFVLTALNILMIAFEKLAYPRLRDHIRQSLLYYIVGTAAFLKRALDGNITRAGRVLMAMIFVLCAFGIALNFISLLIRRIKSEKVPPDS